MPVTDRGFLFGDGIFTTIRVANGYPEFLDLHVKKLARDCEAIGIIPQKVSEEEIFSLIQLNQADEGVWRLKILMTGGSEPGISLAPRASGQCLITIKPYLSHALSYRLVSYSYSVNYPMAKFKSLSYLDRLWIADYASKHGFDDALLYDHDGIILETSTANIFWRKGQDLFFPDSSLPLYQGVTLQMVLVAAEKLGMNLFPVKAKLNEVSNEAQLYLCNSLKGIVPVVAIDEKSFERDLSFEEILKINLTSLPYPLTLNFLHR